MVGHVAGGLKWGNGNGAPLGCNEIDPTIFILEPKHWSQSNEPQLPKHHATLHEASALNTTLLCCASGQMIATQTVGNVIFMTLLVFGLLAALALVRSMNKTS